MGETGTGKTTACQAAAAAAGQRLHIVNCNQHTEASDFLGGFRPSRCDSRYPLPCSPAPGKCTLCHTYSRALLYYDQHTEANGFLWRLLPFQVEP